MIKGLIFDFDGVIAESIEVKTNAFAKLYNEYGKEISNKVIQHHKLNGGVSRFEKIKFYHQNYLNKNITKDELEKLLSKFSNYVVSGVIQSPYVDGVLNFIKNKFKDHKLFISTATPTEEIKTIIQARKIENYFTDVFGSPDKKTNHIDLIMSKHKINYNELIFFGDSETDYFAAEEKKIKFILIENNYNKLFRKNYSGKSISTFKDFK